MTNKYEREGKPRRRRRLCLLPTLHAEPSPMHAYSRILIINNGTCSQVNGDRTAPHTHLFHTTTQRRKSPLQTNVMWEREAKEKEALPSPHLAFTLSFSLSPPTQSDRKREEKPLKNKQNMWKGIKGKAKEDVNARWGEDRASFSPLPVPTTIQKGRPRKRRWFSLPPTLHSYPSREAKKEAPPYLAFIPPSPHFPPNATKHKGKNPMVKNETEEEEDMNRKWGEASLFLHN